LFQCLGNGAAEASWATMWLLRHRSWARHWRLIHYTSHASERTTRTDGLMLRHRIFVTWARHQSYQRQQPAWRDDAGLWKGYDDAMSIAVFAQGHTAEFWLEGEPT